MKCLRCGWCCKHLSVVVVDDPDQGTRVTNLVHHPGTGKPCKHLRGKKPGKYRCAVHDRRWYRQTPCYRHGQIERNKDDPCRMGLYQLGEIGCPQG